MSYIYMNRIVCTSQSKHLHNTTMTCPSDTTSETESVTDVKVASEPTGRGWGGQTAESKNKKKEKKEKMSRWFSNKEDNKQRSKF